MNRTRVGYLLKKFPRLSETFVLNEILMQEQLGSEVHVFSRRAVDDEPRHPQLARLAATIETLPSTHEIDPWRELFVTSQDAIPIDKLGQLVRSMQPFRLERLPRLLAEAIFLQRRTSELEIEHLHVHFATDSAVVAMLLRELGGPSYSVTAHAKDIYRSTINPELLARIIDTSEFTITVCDANVRHLEGMLPGVTSKRVRRLYNGVDLSAFQPSGVPRDAAHVLAVGRLVPKKGFHVLLDALATLRERGVDFHATIIGDGPEREALLAQAAQLGLSELVRFTGPLDQGAVREYLRKATVFCLPCVIDADGNRDALPTVLLEALAAGLPVVSTPVTGIPEILAEGRAGALVPMENVAATADALERFLSSPAERARFADEGRRHVEQHFDACAVAETLREWLRSPVPVSA